MIPQSVEYSMRAMVLLAQNADEPLTVQTIATKGQMPTAYLAKLLQVLTRAGLVTSKRGPGGGFLLAKHSTEIRLADIVNVVEPIQRIRTCPLGPGDHETLCSLHQWIDELFAVAEASLRETTLDDVLRSGSNRLGVIPLRNPLSL